MAHDPLKTGRSVPRSPSYERVDSRSRSEQEAGPVVETSSGSRPPADQARSHVLETRRSKKPLLDRDSFSGRVVFSKHRLHGGDESHPGSDVIELRYSPTN